MALDAYLPPALSDAREIRTGDTCGMCDRAAYRPKVSFAGLPRKILASATESPPPRNVCYSEKTDRAAAITKLKEHEAELKQLGVEHLYLFGSTARGEAREDSDVDLFFDHPVGSLGLFELMDVKDAAARILGRKTDIMTRRSLHPVLRERIEASALQVF